MVAEIYCIYLPILEPVMYQIVGGNENRIFNVNPGVGKIYTILDVWCAQVTVSYVSDLKRSGPK